MATPLCLFAGSRWAFCEMKPVPRTFEKQPCQFSLLGVVPGGGGITQTHPNSTARKRHRTPWPQKLSSSTRHAVTGFGDLTYLSHFRLPHHISPSFFEDTEQRGGCVRQGFCLMLGVCCDRRDLLLFQTQS